MLARFDAVESMRSRQLIYVALLLLPLQSVVATDHDPDSCDNRSHLTTTRGGGLAAAGPSKGPDRHRIRGGPTRRSIRIPGTLGELHNPGTVKLRSPPVEPGVYLNYLATEAFSSSTFIICLTIVIAGSYRSSLFFENFS